MNRRLSVAAMAMLSCALAFSAQAQTEPPADPLTQIAIATLPGTSSTRLTVTSPAFGADGDIPFANTMYRTNTFPGLAWSTGPKVTRSYAIVMQDPDTLFHGAPLVHWTLFNVPASMTRLEPGMTAPPEGSQYGPNGRGSSQPYRGPHTPPGPKHHYHFQVFALDTVLPKAPDIDYAGLTAAMNGHVLASGELVGLSYADPEAKPVAPKN
ncbi:MAG: YbhB/YbcL family Raf kinase inhibitor-like protein [Caulobacteraceae bacterium]